VGAGGTRTHDLTDSFWTLRLPMIDHRQRLLPAQMLWAMSWLSIVDSGGLPTFEVGKGWLRRLCGDRRAHLGSLLHDYYPPTA
jgi:hypothetical protein